MNLYERIASSAEGVTRFAAARLRYRALGALHEALAASGLSQTQLAERLGVRKSAVNQVLRGDGNVRVNTLAEYLSALGFELDIELVPAGEFRQRALGSVAPNFVPIEWTGTSLSSVSNDRFVAYSRALHRAASFGPMTEKPGMEPRSLALTGSRLYGEAR